MAEQAGAMQDIRLQFQNFFGSLTLAKRITIIASIGVIIGGMAILIILSNRQTYAPLFTGLETNDAAVIADKLQENQIPYNLAPGGRTIFVPSEMVDQARLALAREKVLPGSGVGFADMLEGTKLGETERQQDIRFRVAQEGELARLITRIESIKSAKVQLAIPQKTLFSDSEESTTASVSLESGQVLSKNQVDTIVHLVAAAVEGLDPSNVRISDQAGRLLSRGFAEDSVSGELNENYSYKRRIELEQEEKILAQLEPIVGKDRVKVKVFADVEFDRQQIKEEIIDPESIVISEQVLNENSTGQRSLPVGPAGVTTNLPEAIGREAATTSEFSKQNTTRNYQTSKKEIISTPAAGRIKGLSVAVLLDNKHPAIVDDDGNIVGRDSVQWNIAEKEEIERLVKAAIGFTEDNFRKDQVYVANMEFGLPVEEDVQSQLEEAERNRVFILDIIKYTALGVSILALIMLVIRPMVQRLSAKPADLDLLMGLPATIGELEGEELEIPTEREAGIPPRDKIIDIARQDSIKTASMIRAWLKEKK